MLSQFEKYKGIRPGAILDHELRKRKLSIASFAFSINEAPGTIEAIAHGEISLDTTIATKAEKALGIDTGTFMELQQYYEAKIKLEAERRKFHPNLSILRSILFWDTDINRIDWEKHAKFVIQRVFERGNEAEKEEITRFYGLEKVNAVLNQKFPTGEIHVMGHLKVR